MDIKLADPVETVVFNGKTLNMATVTQKGRKKKGATTPAPDTSYYIPHAEKPSELGQIAELLFSAAESKSQGGGLRLFVTVFGDRFKEALKNATDKDTGDVDEQKVFDGVVSVDKAAGINLNEYREELLNQRFQIDQWLPMGSKPSDEEIAACAAARARDGVTEEQAVMQKVAWVNKTLELRELELEAQVTSEKRAKTRAENKAKKEAAAKVAGAVPQPA